MKYILTSTLFLCLFMSAHAQLKVGDKMPEFSLPDQNGKMISSKEILANGPAVIYFYPKDDTPGCTKEACSFRDNFEAFTEAGARVVGISADDVDSHKKFEEKYLLPFTLLADTDNSVRNKFGVSGDLFGLIPGRVSFVVDKNGIILHVFDSQMDAEKHMSESLAILKSKIH